MDLAYSWYQRGWGHRFVDDPLSFIPVFKSKDGGFVPSFLYKWNGKFKKMPETDRIINSILVLNSMNKDIIRQLPSKQRKQVLIITYEDLVERTGKALKQIGYFLGVTVSPRMPKILKRENCPKEISLKQRQAKIESIKKIASKKMFNNMMRLAEDYEEHFFGR